LNFPLVVFHRPWKPILKGAFGDSIVSSRRLKDASHRSSHIAAPQEGCGERLIMSEIDGAALKNGCVHWTKLAMNLQLE
jgi:hypothetical protein